MTKNTIFLFVVVISALVSSAASADDPDGRRALYVANVQMLRDCIASDAFAENTDACVRLTIPVCEASNSETPSHSELAACFYDELEIWEGFYTELLLEILRSAQRHDADASLVGSSAGGTFRNVLTAEAAWLDYRQKECVRENDRWGAGTAANIGIPYCHMKMLGRRVRFLSSLDYVEINNDN